MSLIALKNLSKIYQNDGVETIALNNVSLMIEQGEFVAIMGPSGSGKSTLMHIMGFLDRPSEGQYIFGGQSSEGLDDESLAHLRNEKVGFIFQAFNFRTFAFHCKYAETATRVIDNFCSYQEIAF